MGLSIKLALAILGESIFIGLYGIDHTEHYNTFGWVIPVQALGILSFQKYADQ